MVGAVKQNFVQAATIKHVATFCALREVLLFFSGARQNLHTDSVRNSAYSRKTTRARKFADYEKDNLEKITSFNADLRNLMNRASTEKTAHMDGPRLAASPG